MYVLAPCELSWGLFLNNLGENPSPSLVNVYAGEDRSHTKPYGNSCT